MTVRTRRLVLMAIAAALALAPGSAAAAPGGKLIDTLSVDAGKLTITSGTVALEAGAHYILLVTGTQASQDASGASTLVSHDDALYCYDAQGNGINQCSPPFPAEELFVTVGSLGFGSNSSTGPDIDEYATPAGPHPAEREVPYRSDHTYKTDFIPPVSGVLKAAGYNAVYGCGARHTTCFNQTSGTFTIQVYAAEPAVEIGFTGRRVEVQVDGAPWQVLVQRMKLHVGDRVHTGWRSSARLTLPGGSTLFIPPMSLVSIERLEVNPDGSLKAHVFLGLGEIKAQIQKLPGSRGDFQVRTPTTTASVRGTRFSVLYDGSATIVSVTAHTVAVTPTRGRMVLVRAGMEVASTATGTGPLAPLGRAGAPPGGPGPAAALTRLAARLSGGIAACRADLYGTSLSRRASDWQAAAAVVGQSHGPALWTIAGGAVSPDNALARRLTTGCRRGGSLALSWSGWWQTSFGLMRLVQSGSRVSGRYAPCGGAATITGAVLSGATLFGGWSRPCDSRSGQFAFSFAPDGNSFTGRWGYAGAAATAAWTGKRR